MISPHYEPQCACVSSANQKRISILVDTPNVARSVTRHYGVGSYADYQGIYSCASKFGAVSHACALVNDGVSPRFTASLRTLGFTVQESHAFDCDDALIARAIRLQPATDIFMLCSGDGHYLRLVQLLRAVGVQTVVCAVEGSCSRRLKSVGLRYVEIPIRTRGQRYVPQAQLIAK